MLKGRQLGRSHIILGRKVGFKRLGWTAAELFKVIRMEISFFNTRCLELLQMDQFIQQPYRVVFDLAFLLDKVFGVQFDVRYPPLQGLAEHGRHMVVGNSMGTRQGVSHTLVGGRIGQHPDRSSGDIIRADVVHSVTLRRPTQSGRIVSLLEIVRLEGQRVGHFVRRKEDGVRDEVSALHDELVAISMLYHHWDVLERIFGRHAYVKVHHVASPRRREGVEEGDLDNVMDALGLAQRKELGEPLRQSNMKEGVDVEKYNLGTIKGGLVGRFVFKDKFDHLGSVFLQIINCRRTTGGVGDTHPNRSVPCFEQAISNTVTYYAISSNKNGVLLLMLFLEHCDRSILF